MQVDGLTEKILDFWFGESPATHDSVKRRSKNWFSGVAEFDQTIREVFASDVDRALSDRYQLDAQDARHALALVLILDQFPRNIFRRDPQAFAGDRRALQIVREVIAAGTDRSLGAVECGFLFMPFQHCESLADQEEGLERLAGLVQRAADWEMPYVESFYKYAGLHCNVVREFGRFPHRNEILDRVCTPAEQAYLDGNGHRFGQ